MSDVAPDFNRAVAEAYSASLASTMFQPHGDDLAARVPAFEGLRVLEVGAGTGVVTRALLDRLPSTGRVVATDISTPMLEVGRAYIGDDPRLEWRVADALALPFADASFDALVCQFALMFFPDKPLAMREAKRVLRPGGTLLLNTWDNLEANPYARVTNETLAELYPSDPPRFFYLPYSYNDPTAMRDLLVGAGFAGVEVERVDAEAVSESSDRFARGLVTGTPISGDLRDRGTLDVDQVALRLAERLAALGGAAPHRSPMRALVATARA